jgi:hypothetical protein
MIIMKTSIRSTGLLAALAMGLTSPLFSQVPDLTKDTQSVDRKLTYNPGATGLRGWIHTKAANNLDAAHFQEGIAAAVGLAKTQGGHGSENRTGEIMKMVTSYGFAAKPQIPALRELIVSFNAEVERREYPGGELNNRRVNAVEEAIKTIETAKDHLPLRSTKSASKH